MEIKELIMGFVSQAEGGQAWRQKDEKDHIHTKE